MRLLGRPTTTRPCRVAIRRRTPSRSGTCRNPIEILDRLLEHRNRYDRLRHPRTHFFGCIGPVAVVGHVGFGLVDWVEQPTVDVTKWWTVPQSDGPLNKVVRNDLGDCI